MIGAIISHYKIIEKLGGGGMGVVYKAQDLKLARAVALKFLPPSFSFNDEAKKRFIHEAQAASALDHPNICTIHEIGETKESNEVAAGQLYIVMAYYEGKTLKEKIEEGPLKIEEAIKIAIQISEGLNKAHKKEIVHRDIKPANIFITGDGTVKILDFGLAKVTGQTQLTQLGSTVGTASYMSPEQASGGIVGYRSDIWSLGVLLYEMITGQQPFKGEYDQALIYSIINEVHEPPTGLRTGVPMDLERIIDKALKKDPDERYQNMSDLLVDLRAISKMSENRKKEKGRPAAKHSNKKQAYIFVSLFVMFVLLAVGARYLFTGNTNVINSIAVLPLENLSGDPEQEYFVDGMTNALISKLAQISALRVISRTSIMQYKDVRKSIQEIAQELNVDVLVEGTVLHDENQVRITVQLIRATPEQHLWGSDYKRDLQNIFELQEEVARSIAKEINVTVTKEEQLRLTSAKTVDPEVYELYLKGAHYADKVTKEGLAKSIKYYNKAIEKDSTFALAYAGLAESYLRGAWSSGEKLEKFNEAAIKALELDYTQSGIYYMNALLKFWKEWDILGAEKELKKALEINPNYAKAHDLYCNVLILLKRFEEAIIEREKSIKLDPLSHVFHCNGCFTYYVATEYDKALELANFTMEHFGSACSFEDITIAAAYNEKGMYEKAISVLTKRWKLSNADTRVLTGIGRAYALSGQIDSAKQKLKELNEIGMDRNGKPYYYMSAIIQTALGDKNEALASLEKSYEHREWLFPWVDVDQRFDPLRSEPRFDKITSQLNF